MKRRIWIDTLAAAKLGKEDFERLIRKDYKLVISNTAVDVKAFQENLGWFESQLVKETIIIEVWNTPDEMTKKPFFWTSCQQTTQPAETFAEAIEPLDAALEIKDIAEMVMVYGIPKGEWNPGEWAPPQPISIEMAEALGIPIGTENRTEILLAAEAANRMDIFNKYNLSYCKGLARQHCCYLILTEDGEAISIDK